MLVFTVSPSSILFLNSTVPVERNTFEVSSDDYADDYDSLRTACAKKIGAPGVFIDPELGCCTIHTNLPSYVLEMAGINLDADTTNGLSREAPSFDKISTILSQNAIESGLRSGNVYVVCTVPSLWTQEQDVPVRFYLYNDGYTTAYVTLEFTSYDLNSEEEYEDENTVQGYTTVRGYRDKVKYLYLDTTDTPIGIWGGRAEAGSDASYYKDFGYTFVQKFDIPSTLPASDDMSEKSQNSNYYWEGISSIDGYNIVDDYALYHCDDWQMRWLAADLIDLDHETDRYDLGETMTHVINDEMTVYWDDYSVPCSWSDYHIIDMDFKGVCDEHANLAISLLRALGIASRRIGAILPNQAGHAWLELWAYNGDVWTWIHSDPTWDEYDNPECYNGPSWINIHSRWDDSKLYDACDGDGSDTNGLLANQGINKDRTYEVLYDGPNDYS